MRPTDASAQLFPSPFIVTNPPSAVEQPSEPAPNFEEFSGGWWKHGFDVTINPNGWGEASWRTYNSCDGARTDAACDRVEGNTIYRGGFAVLHLDRVESSTAFGTVMHSTDEVTLPNGAFRLTLREYGLADLAATDSVDRPIESIGLCGQGFMDAPEWFRRTSPCGA